MADSSPQFFGPNARTKIGGGVISRTSKIGRLFSIELDPKIGYFAATPNQRTNEVNTNLFGRPNKKCVRHNHETLGE
jgi:hypothetical protein